MIFGLPKMAMAAYMLAAASACPAASPPVVHLDFVDTPPVELNDQTSHQLGAFHISTVFSRSRNEVFTVGGITLSDFSPVYLIDFNNDADAGTGDACLSVKTVNITVKYAPTIYVASEYKPGTCRFDSTLQHEVRHVNTDVITFNEQLPALRQAVEDAADKVGIIGPIAQKDLLPQRDKIVDGLKGALVAKVQEIQGILGQRQQMIDTRQEYLRLQKLCEGDPLPRP